MCQPLLTKILIFNLTVYHLTNIKVTACVRFMSEVITIIVNNAAILGISKGAAMYRSGEKKALEYMMFNDKEGET